MLVPDICAQWMLRDLLLPFRISFDNRVISLLCLVFFKLEIQRTMSLCITREDHHAACDLIQSMDNKDFAISFFQYFKKILRLLFPSIRQDGQSGGLVQDD